MSDLKYWIALSMLPDVGPLRARNLLDVFNSPEQIFNAREKELVSVEGIGANRARHICAFTAWEEVSRQMALMESANMRVVHLGESVYPEMLKETVDAPVVLYVKGDPQPQDRYAVGIVGSRMPSPYGISVAEKLSEDLASMGFTVVSGMARGIDSLSHKGALKTGGRTIAVLGSGIDIPYPPEN